MTMEIDALYAGLPMGQLDPCDGCAKLAAEVEALRKDAGRYRWLRDSQPNRETLACGEIEIGKYVGMYWDKKCYRGKEIDAAIDAAMAARPVGKT